MSRDMCYIAAGLSYHNLLYSRGPGPGVTSQARLSQVKLPVLSEAAQLLQRLPGPGPQRARAAADRDRDVPVDRAH